MAQYNVGLALTILVGCLVIILPRKLAILFFLLGAVLIPLQAKFVIGSLDFHSLRILVLLAWVRLLLRSERGLGKLNSIDQAMILWGIASITTYTLLWQTWPAFINRSGMLLNALGSYFFFRCIIKSLDDLQATVKALVLVSLVLGATTLIEWNSGRNLYHLFLGGGSEISLARRFEAFRCQGPFGHSISAGIFGAAIFPLSLSLWWKDLAGKRLAIAGCVAATFIVWASSSSGPMVAYAAAIVGLMMWPLRRRMRLVRRGVFLSLVALHIVMKAPVWALIGRAGVYSGSSGYHRFMLVDQFIHRFNEWWLLGTTSSENWTHLSFDVSNKYVRTGVDGGLISLVLLIAVIVLCFKQLGRIIWSNGQNPEMQKIVWLFGVSLLTHMVSFFGFSYWDQIMVIWYLLVALIASLGNFHHEVDTQSGLSSDSRLGDWSQPQAAT